MTFEGDHRAETLTGLVTNDIGALTAGSGLYAAALTPRGKIIADLRVFAREADLLIDVPVRASAGWVAMVRKYVNPRTTRYADQSESLADLGVFGVRARTIVGTAVGVSGEMLAALAPYSHVVGTLGGNSVLVARVPDIGVEGYEVIAPVEARPQLWRCALELGVSGQGAHRRAGTRLVRHDAYPFRGDRYPSTRKGPGAAHWSVSNRWRKPETTLHLAGDRRRDVSRA